MITLTYDKEQLQKMKQTYFETKALYETIKDAAEEIQKKILTNNKFYAEKELLRGEKGGRILRPFDTYLMNGADFEKYLDLCYAEYQDAEIADKRGKDYIPEAEAQNLYWEAEKQLVLYAIDIIPDGMEEKTTLREAVKNIKYKEKVLDLILKLEC